MSFDIFLQGFKHGEADPGHPDAAHQALQPYLRISSNGMTNVVTDDGDGEVYGVGTDSLMFTHASGRRSWDIIVEVAKAGYWAIMLVGCPTCVPTSSIIADLPDVLRADAVVVNSGADVIDVILRA